MKKIYVITIGASLILAPFFYAVAEVPVVESVSTLEMSLKAELEKTNKTNAELGIQLQSLQDELQNTRGNIEELQHELQVLKKKRLEDYVNIDKRLTELTTVNPTLQAALPVDPTLTNNVVPNSDENTLTSDLAPTVIPTVAISSQNSNVSVDAIEYQKSYDLIKALKFDEAKLAFTDFLVKYPKSEYCGNANYWIGALYFRAGNFLEAKKSYQTVLKNYPDNPKYPDALLGVATVNYELGDRTTARQQLIELTNYKDQTVSAVPKARDFLRKNNL